MEQLGHYRLHQLPGVFPLGQDSLRLGAFATARRGDRVCDLGCGGGALLLLLAGRAEQATRLGIESDPAAAALCRRNLAENELDGTILTGDLAQLAPTLPAGQCDLVVSNPPYFAAGTGTDGGCGRMERSCTLDDVCAAAAWLLRNGGRFALVHRPERLAALFAALARHNLEPKRLQLIQHSATKAPSAVLLEAMRQGRPGLCVLPTAL